MLQAFQYIIMLFVGILFGCVVIHNWQHFTQFVDIMCSIHSLQQSFNLSSHALAQHYAECTTSCCYGATGSGLSHLSVPVPDQNSTTRHFYAVWYISVIGCENFDFKLQALLKLTGTLSRAFMWTEYSLFKCSTQVDTHCQLRWHITSENYR